MLAGKPGTPDDIDDLTLPPRTVLKRVGEAIWDGGMAAISDAHARLAAAAAAAGLQPAGRPLVLFVETDANGFRYEAWLPVAQAPAAGIALDDGISVAPGPSGRALRFVHRGPYSEIDTTYEAITAYLDGKGITVQDRFVEEYVGDLSREADAAFEVNIYVLPQ